MNKDAIDMFLESLKIKYKTISFSSDTDSEIYRDLCRFNAFGKLFNNYIVPENLMNIQIKLSNRYNNDRRLNRVDRKNNRTQFWGVENICGEDAVSLREKLFDGIKIYIPVESEKIYWITCQIIDFTLRENIPMQLKVSNVMRNDAITMRVTTKEDALKLERFLNKELDYQTRINPNPFLYKKGKIALTYDGNLSFNKTISKLLSRYIISKKNSGILDTVSVDDFLNYIKNQKIIINGPDKKFYCDYYNLIDSSRYENFNKIIEILIKNIEETMTLDGIFKMQEVEKVNSYDYEITDERIKKACKYADRLKDYCINNFKDETVYKRIIEEFINTGSFEVFPELDDIRKDFRENFTLELFKEVIWTLIVRVLGDTYDKYGNLQYQTAVANLMYDENEDFKILTNEKDNRSNLCQIASKRIIKKILQNKALQYNKPYIINDMLNIISEEIEKRKKKSEGRK